MKLRLVLVAVWAGVWVAAAAGQATSQPTPLMEESQIRDLMDKAQDALQRGDETGAAKHLDQLVDVAHQAWERENVTTAEWILRKVNALRQDYPKGLFALAELYRQTNPMWAIQYYTRYLQLNPNEAEAYFGRGSCYLARDVLGLAVQDLRFLVEQLAPRHVGGLTNLALALRRQAMTKGNDVALYREALGCMRRAVDAAVAGGTAGPLATPADLKHRYARMTYEYQTLLAKVQPDQINFAESEAAFDAAIQETEKMIRADPIDPAALNQLALCYDDLRSLYEFEAERNRKDAGPLLKLADLCELRNRLNERITKVQQAGYLARAVAAEPNQTRLRIRLVELYRSLGAVGPAREAVEAGLQLAPGDPALLALQKEFAPAAGAASQPAGT